MEAFSPRRFDLKGINWKDILNNFEIYLGAAIFFCLMILLTFQVVSRYVFNFALTWCEELAITMFMWMIYCGVAGSVMKRRHLSIEFFRNLLPFQAKKVVLILNNVITMAFCGYIIVPMTELIINLANSGAKSPILGMNRAACYAVAPIMLVLTIIRYVQENVTLAKECEDELGAARPVLDVAALEREYLESCKRKEAEDAGEGAQQKARGDGADGGEASW